MRIVFMGTPEFAVPSLKALLDSNHDVVAVVTAPDKPSGRGLKLRASAVKDFAQLRKVPILQPLSLKDAGTFQDLTSLKADLFVIVAFRILPSELIAIPTQGAINLHASLLPQYRGAAPINWAIINGEMETGATTFFLKPKVDTGNILLQQATVIGEDETAGELHDRLMILGADVVVKTVAGIEAGSLTARPQVDHPGLKPAPKIFPEDCELKPTLSSTQSHNFIRGLSPHPGAWLTHHGKRLKLLRSKRIDENPSSNSIVFDHENKLLLKTADGCLELVEVQPEGKRKMSGEEFVRGWKPVGGK